MSRGKGFDCVELKNRLQADVLSKHAGKTDGQIRAERQRSLEAGDDPVARWWRAVTVHLGTRQDGPTSARQK
jgi:hypothetical protein